MKEITRIHLAKIPYEIELDAKKNLQKYLDELRKYSDEEIFEDVEIRITEILAESGISKNGIISEKEAQKIRAQIGEPEIFKGEDFEEETSSEKSSSDFETEKLPKNFIATGKIRWLLVFWRELLDISKLTQLLFDWRLFC